MMFFDAHNIPLENFVKVEDARDGNMEDPTLVDFEKAAETINTLKTNRVARVPQIQKGVRKEWVEG